jgi:putative restriction endonuclease
MGGQLVRNNHLEEIDGPMLRYGFQQLHDQKLILPKSKKVWPDQEKLEWRYVRFRESA